MKFTDHKKIIIFKVSISGNFGLRIILKQIGMRIDTFA